MTRFRVNSVEYPRNRLRFEYSCLSNIGPACHCTKRVRYNVSFPCNVTTEGHISPNKSGRCTERIRCLNYNGLLIFLDLFDPISPDAAHCPGRRGLSRTACSSADSRFVNRSLVHHLDNMRIVRRTTGRRRIVAYPRTGKNVSASSIRSIETVPRRKVDRTITVGSWGGGRKTRRSPFLLFLSFSRVLSSRSNAFVSFSSTLLFSSIVRKRSLRSSIERNENSFNGDHSRDSRFDATFFIIHNRKRGGNKLIAFRFNRVAR